MLTYILYFCIKLGLLQLYPSYITYKAIKSSNQQEYTSLLIFWIVAIAYLSAEYFSDILLFWLPFYTEFKLIIILWLILPQTQGTTVVYHKYLYPYLQQNEAYIDSTLIEIQHKLKETIVLYGKQLIEGIKKLIIDLFFKGQQSEATAVPEPEAPQEQVITPFRLFSTLIQSASQLTPTTADETPKDSKVPVQEMPVKGVPKENEHAKENELDRINSQESIQSYVSVNTANENKEAITWGNYLSSWIWTQKNKTE